MRPLDLLYYNLRGDVMIQLKKNQRIHARLVGFDEHLNLCLENVRSEYYIEQKVEEGNSNYENDEEEIQGIEPSQEPEGYKMVKVSEDLGNLILRGDNVVLMKFLHPRFSKPQRKSHRRPSDDIRRKDRGKEYGEREPRNRAGGNRRNSNSRRTDARGARSGDRERNTGSRKPRRTR